MYAAGLDFNSFSPRFSQTTIIYNPANGQEKAHYYFKELILLLLKSVLKY